jgi:hypothetical protein
LKYSSLQIKQEAPSALYTEMTRTQGRNRCPE